jgi:ABC-type amino acid transport substrate-binding protein
MVPEEILRAEFVAFSKKPSLRAARWSDLAPYHVGIVRGCKIAEINSTNAKSVTRAKDLKMAFSLLAANKVDLVIYDRLHGKVLLDEIKQKGIYAGEQPLAKQSMYLYLNNKHTSLVPRVAKSIRGMKADGTFAVIVDDVMRALFR